MKKIATILLLISSLISSAQGPVIEGTYLPVRGTAVKEVWDMTYNTMTVPAGGQNVVWDYSNEFLNAIDTFKIRTFHPDSIVNGHSFSQYFPTATHASFLRTPLNNLSDSIYNYFIIDATGLHNLGGFNIRHATNNTVGYDTTAIVNPSELMVPSIATFGMSKNDTSKYITYGIYSNLPIKVRGTKYKTMIGYGYGTLKMPNGSIFNDVLLARQNIQTVDSVFLAGTNNFITQQISNNIEYSFLRNNTFGSSYLMYLDVNSANTIVINGWYALPVDFGSISGTVYDSLNQANVVPNGEALLYRENSNFSKNDILDRSPLDANGHYQFDSIPYGDYRVAIRPDTLIYPTALTTYWGDSINGNSAPTIITTTNSTGNNIHLKYFPDSVGLGQIQGHLNLDNGMRDSNPIPGVDVIVRKNPGGIAMHEVKTGFYGEFSVSALSDGNYDLFVDIPGLPMAGTYEFTIAGGTLVTCLDFTSGTDSIHPICQATVSVNTTHRSADVLDVYPNPYSSSTTIKMNITEKSDVSLEVYNILGEKIQTLEKGQKQPGIYSYNFNAKSLNYSSGIYFVKLTVGDKLNVLKIIEQ